MPLKSSLIAVLLALCVAALAQQPTATPRPSTTAQTPTLQPADDAKTEAEAIKTGRATIQWDKSSTPGTKARLELIKTGTIQGKPVVD